MGWTRKLSLGSGLVLFVFVTSHFLNHALGNISLAAMEAGREVFIAIWRNWPVTILLYGAIFLHVLMALWAVWRRRTLRMSPTEGFQVVLALCIPFLMPAHVLATRGGHEFFGLNDSYLYEILTVWVLAPENGWLLAVGLVLSVGYAGSGDRRADASAEQVAPAGCLERLRSPGDRTSRFCRGRVCR